MADPAHRSSSPSPSQLAAVSCVFLALSIVFTWPIAAHLSDSIPADLGDPLLNAWALGWTADRVLHGLRGLWDAPIFYPYHNTLAFSEHLLGIAIPVAPVVWATGNPLIAYNVAFVLSFVLAGVGMFLLTWELTARSEPAWIAALVFAFAPARFGQIGHLQTLMSGWMPLSLWGLTRFLKSRSPAALAACVVFTVVQGLSNNYFIYFLSLPLLAVALHGTAHAPRVERSSLLIRLAAAGLVVVVALTPIALVYFSVRHTFGFHRTLQDANTFGADLATYLHGNEAVHPPLAAWRHLPFVAKPGGPEGELFPGAVALLLAGVAAISACRRWHDTTRSNARLYTVVLLLALTLSMGAAPTAWGTRVPIGAIFRGLFAIVPGFDGIRVPARFSVIVDMAIAVLAGFGLIDLMRAIGSRRVQRATTIVIAAAILLEGFAPPIPMAYVAEGGRPDRPVYDWIRDHAAGPLIELPTGDFAPPLQSYRYEYQTLFHHRPIVNGASGYTPGLHAFVGGFGSPLVEPSQIEDGLRMLRALGVRTVIVRPEDYANRDVGAMTVTLLRESAQVTARQEFPGVEIFQLAAFRENDAATPTRPSPRVAAGNQEDLVQIERKAFEAAASILPERIGNAFDGDIATRWISSKRQEGDERLEVAFDRPYDIARLRFWTSGRSLGDYPRHLIVESLDSIGGSAIVYDGEVVFQLGLGFVADPIHATTDIWMRPNRSVKLRIRQTGTTRRWAWSIDELSFWRTPD